MKKKLFYFFNILLFLTVTSCSDIFLPQDTSISFSLGESVAREISDSVSVSSQVSENTEFIVKVMFEGLNLEPQEIKVTKSKLSTASFLFDNILFNRQFKILIDVYFNNIVIYSGESNFITLTDANDGAVIDITINRRLGKISYEPKGGTVKEPVLGKSVITEYFISDNISKNNLPVVEKEGYSFAGWYFDEQCTKPLQSLGKDNYVGDVKLFAKWIEIVKDIEFIPPAGAIDYKGAVKLSSGTPGAAIYYTTNGDVPTSSSTLYSDSKPISIDKAQTIKAIAVNEGMETSKVASADYTIKTYTVSFDNGGYGTAPADITGKKKDDSITMPEALTADKMDFLGWSLGGANYNPGESITIDSSQAVNGVITITANWQEWGTVESVTFNPPAGDIPYLGKVSLASGTSGAAIYYTTNGDTPTVSSTPYTGEISINNDQTTIKAIAVCEGMKTSDVAEAAYTATYTVSFDIQGHGNAPRQEKNLKRGDLVPKPADLSEAGYTFGGWCTDTTFKTLWNFDTDRITGGKVLYAKWTPITYKVQFNRNGGDADVAEMGEMTMTYDVAKALTKNTYTRSGFEFIGWNKIQNPSNTKDNISDQASKVFNFKTTQDDVQILYAQWNDIRPEGVTNFTASLNSTRDKVQLSWTNPADKDIASVIINSTEAGLANTSVNVKNKAGQVSTYDVSLSTCLDQGTYNFSVKVKDEGGNECTSDKIRTCNIKLPTISAFSVPNARFNKDITVVVNGTNFKSTAIEASDFKITANGKNVTPSSATIKSDTELQFTIPGSASAKNDTIKVSCVGASSKEGAFEIKENYALYDIVMSDDTLLTKDKCANYKGAAKPVAIIFREKTPTLSAVGLGFYYKHCIWAKSGTTGYATSFDTIKTTPTKADADRDGSDNWGEIVKIDSSAKTNAETNYPAFYFANTYGNNFSGTKYSSGWYLPALGEIVDIGMINDTLNTAIYYVETFVKNADPRTEEFVTTMGACGNMWSSNQAGNNANAAYGYHLADPNHPNDPKDKATFGEDNNQHTQMHACAVHKFE